MHTVALSAPSGSVRRREGCAHPDRPDCTGGACLQGDAPATVTMRRSNSEQTLGSPPRTGPLRAIARAEHANRRARSELGSERLGIQPSGTTKAKYATVTQRRSQVVHRHRAERLFAVRRLRGSRFRRRAEVGPARLEAVESSGGVVRDCSSVLGSS